MQNQSELVLTVENAAHEMDRRARELFRLASSMRSSADTDVTSSTTQSTARAGGGCLSGTSGLTADQVRWMAEFLAGFLHAAGAPKGLADMMPEVLADAHAFMLSYYSANGGSASAAPHSAEPPDNSRGPSSDPTPSAETSVPTPTTTRIDLNALPLMVADRLFGTSVPLDDWPTASYHTMRAVLGTLHAEFPDHCTI